MVYVGLDEITSDHLLGDWHVANRFNINKDTTNIFSKNERLIFDRSSFKATNGMNVIGGWEIKMKQDSIYNPQVLFYLDNAAIAKAIITRLMIPKESLSANKLDYILTLYFFSGLELVLNKHCDGDDKARATDYG